MNEWMNEIEHMHNAQRTLYTVQTHNINRKTYRYKEWRWRWDTNQQQQHKNVHRNNSVDVRLEKYVYFIAFIATNKQMKRTKTSEKKLSNKPKLATVAGAQIVSVFVCMCFTLH